MPPTCVRGSNGVTKDLRLHVPGTYLGPPATIMSATKRWPFYYCRSFDTRVPDVHLTQGVARHTRRTILLVPRAHDHRGSFVMSLYLDPKGVNYTARCSSHLSTRLPSRVSRRARPSSHPPLNSATAFWTAIRRVVAMHAAIVLEALRCSILASLADRRSRRALDTRTCRPGLGRSSAVVAAGDACTVSPSLPPAAGWPFSALSKVSRSGWHSKRERRSPDKPARSPAEGWSVVAFVAPVAAVVVAAAVAPAAVVVDVAVVAVGLGVLAVVFVEAFVLLLFE